MSKEPLKKAEKQILLPLDEIRALNEIYQIIGYKPPPKKRKLRRRKK